MIKLLAAGAAAMTFALAGSENASAWCDEDCLYEAHEAAQETAYERAAERSERLEEPDDEARTFRAMRRGDDRAAAAAMMQKNARSSRARQMELQRAAQRDRSDNEARASEPSTPPIEAPSPSKAANENSSIATASTRIADDDGYARPSSRPDPGCKTFFPATGMTLSVPCD